MLKSKIIDCLRCVANDLFPEQKTVSEAEKAEIFVPEKEIFGHYSSSIALKLAKTRGENPLAIADSLKSRILNFKSDLFEKIEAAPPGFVNFWLSSQALQKEIKEILGKRKNYGKSRSRPESGKINLEFISANPTGPLTVGHGRGVFLGESLANILKFQGYKIVKEYYINDAKISAQIKELGKTAIGEGTNYLTENLRLKIQKQKAKIKSLTEKFENKSEQCGAIGYLLAREIQKDNRRFVEKELRIKFNRWFSEQKLHQNGVPKKLLENLKQKNLTYQKDGALWLKTGRFGDSEDRVLVRTGGEPTYFLSDLAYHLNKFQTRGFSLAIDIWGADHHGYLPRLKAGLKALGVAENRLEVIITQLVRLIKDGKEARMSKRRGQYVALKDLIAEVGLDAARFFFLMNSPNTHMDFDLDLAKERNLKNPVYYCQYAAVRCQSIIEKGKKEEKKRGKMNLALLDTPEDLNLMRTLGRFPELAEDAAVRREPQILARYALDLAAVFHNFYEKERVVAENRNLTFARLALVKAGQIVFQNLFSLLGISLPKKM